MKPHVKQHIIISSYDEPRNPYYAGGGASAIFSLAKRLDKNYTISILCGKYPGYIDYTKENVHYVHTGVSIGNAKIDQLLFQLSLPFNAATKNFDLWIESFTPPFSAACLSVWTHKPIIGLVHMLSGKDMKRKYGIPFDLLEKITLKFYKHFIVLTDYDKKQIKIINHKASIHVIPNGIHNVSKQTASNKGNYILFLGRIEINQKGLDLLLEAQKLLEKKYRLVIAGTGIKREMEILQKYVKKLKLENSVSIIGRVEGKKKETLYKGALCVVIPSRFETFSLVALEALSYSKPLITFNIPGLSWITKNVRVVVPHMTSASLANALQEISTNKTKRMQLSKNGHQFAKQFNWDNVVMQYGKVILDILRKDQR